MFIKRQKKVLEQKIGRSFKVSKYAHSGVTNVEDK